MGPLTIITTILDLVQAGTVAVERWNEIKARVDAMKAAGRDPTQEEWQALFDEIAADSAALDAADHRLNG